MATNPSSPAGFNPRMRQESHEIGTIRPEEKPSSCTVQEALPTSASSLSREETAVLEALDDAADAFATLPLNATTADGADFDRAVRQLRRIVLARRRT